MSLFDDLTWLGVIVVICVAALLYALTSAGVQNGIRGACDKQGSFILGDDVYDCKKRSN